MTKVKEHEVHCGECSAHMILKKSKFKNPYFYSCSNWPSCTGSHGAHPDGRPLGIPADKETKAARIEAHEAFDELWKNYDMKRKYAYSWLAKILGCAEVHIGESDYETCKLIERVCLEKIEELEGEK